MARAGAPRVRGWALLVALPLASALAIAPLRSERCGARGPRMVAGLPDLPGEGEDEVLPSDDMYGVASASVEGQSEPGPRRPIDSDALKIDQAAFDRPLATPEQLAKHIPSWAANLMLDEEANGAYQTARSKEAAAQFKPVDGRTWNSLDGIDDERADDAGLRDFTPSEVAEDYGLPVETVLATMSQLGVEVEEGTADAPIKATCTDAHVSELLAFVSSADPIAAREELADLSLLELADELPAAIDAEVLLRLCAQHEIALVCGASTRLPHDEYAALVAYAERETAFL